MLSLADGRTLSYAVYGTTSSDASACTGTVFYFHGFPASRYEAAVFHAAAVAHGLRIVAPDRPGMGRSTLQPNRQLLDWPADVLALANHLRVAQFGVLGVSGGAPYVLACCKAMDRERLKAAGVVAGLYPPELGLSGMLLESRIMLFVARWATGLVGKALDSAMGNAARDREHPPAFEAVLAKSFASRPQADRAVWNDNERGFRRILIESTREAMRESARGAAWEARLFGSPWGFRLGDVKMQKGKLMLWHGALDANSPLRMSEEALRLLEGAELRVSPEEAHASLVVRKADEVMKTMKEMMTPPS
jgi:pimeloyl-ACP methyl ester carboxylesterase